MNENKASVNGQNFTVMNDYHVDTELHFPHIKDSAFKADSDQQYERYNKGTKKGKYRTQLPSEFSDGYQNSPFELKPEQQAGDSGRVATYQQKSRCKESFNYTSNGFSPDQVNATGYLSHTDEEPTMQMSPMLTNQRTLDKPELQKCKSSTFFEEISGDGASKGVMKHPINQFTAHELVVPVTLQTEKATLRRLQSKGQKSTVDSTPLMSLRAQGLLRKYTRNCKQDARSHYA